MSGTKAGGLRTVQTISELYGVDYWARIGKIGGSVKNTKKGFAHPDSNPSAAGVKGGSKSRRRPSGSAK